MKTPFGEASVTRGRYAGVDALHLSRHGAGHVRLSNQVTHRANIWALNELGATAVIACTACGAVNPSIELGSLIVFDDLHFISNRLPDGSQCTFFERQGDPQQGHWILHGGPFSPEVRTVLLRAAAQTGYGARDGGAYGYVDGPRFNTPCEIAQLAQCGVTAVSQTAGPETVLCGELELPFALIGFVTDYANQVRPDEPSAAQTLTELMRRSTKILGEVLAEALPRLASVAAVPAGSVLRLG